MKKTIIERKAENQAVIYVLDFIEEKIDAIRKYDIIEDTPEDPLTDWQKESNTNNELVINALCEIADKL